MAHEMLLEFLKRGLINLGASDERLEKLGQTSTDLASALKKNQSKAIAYSLVALDPNISPTDPVVVEVLAALEVKWPTYPNAFPETPVTLVRALLFDVLLTAADADDDIAVAFAAITRNLMPYMPAGAEQSVWTTAVQKVERNVDERASQEWTTPASIGIGDLKITVEESEIAGKITRKTTNKETLRGRITAALVPQQQGGQNPYYPQNQGQQWAQHAVAPLSDAIADTIDAVVKSVEFTGGDISEPFAALSAATTKYVEAAARAFTVAAGGLERRTNLLWWREALYSPSARVSYREISESSAAALMAVDVGQLVPVFSPSSVPAFIKEAVRALDAQEPPKSLRDLVKEAQTAPELDALRSVAKTLAPPMSGRGPLLTVIAQSDGTAGLDEKAFTSAVGVSDKTEIQPTEWANWLYSEIQALKAVQKQRKGRKTQ